jgi:hypothetical protein
MKVNNMNKELKLHNKNEVVKWSIYLHVDLVHTKTSGVMEEEGLSLGVV